MFRHPSKVCLTYKQHMKFSFYLSYKFLNASMGAFVHAIHPDIFITHSSDTIKEVTNEMEKIGCRKKNNKNQ